jgi:CRISPR-associated endonuclease Cas1
MRDNRSAPFTARIRRGEVCLARGFGIRIRVDRQHLVVEDGSGRDRRIRRYARATHGLSRLVVIGSEGYITYEALRWLSRLGIAYVHLDRDGNVLASGEVRSGDAWLRRQQALAASSPVGLEIARCLLGTKVSGQAENLQLVPDSAAARDAIESWIDRIEGATSLDEVLEAEREAAAIYWACWAPLRVRFAARDLARIPEHWQTVGTRHSPLSNGGRVAITPINAALNYLFAVLAAETRIACLTTGLDPGVGIWHVDYRARDSFVLDLMEAARPAVAGHVLGLIRTRTFTRADVGETSRGICRILPPFAEELAQTAVLWREEIAPQVEHVARLLAEAPESRVDERLPTPLTRRNRSIAQATKRGPRPVSPKETAAPGCKRCGAPVPHRDRIYCEACFALPQGERRLTFQRSGDESPSRTTARRCKSCGGPVPHRKRVYCDSCFAEYERGLVEMRRGCARCGGRLPHRKRTYCDACVELARISKQRSLSRP